MGKQKRERARQHQLKKSQQKATEQRTREERQCEIDKIKVQLCDLGFSRGMSEDMDELYDIFDRFVETGESVNVKHAISGTHRIAVGVLSGNRKFPITLCLKYVKEEPESD